MKKKTNFLTSKKFISAITLITACLLFTMAILNNTKAGSADVHASEKKFLLNASQNDFSESVYEQVEAPPIEPEQISVLISAFWIIFGWIVRLIEKRKMKKALKRELRKSATSKDIAMPESEFEEKINKL